MTVWYLSFATNNGFLGAAIVKGESIEEALSNCKSFNPGGEVAAWALKGDAWNSISPNFHNRLLSVEDVSTIDKQTGGPGKAARIADIDNPPDPTSFVCEQYNER